MNTLATNVVNLVFSVKKFESNLHLVSHFVWTGCANSLTLFMADALEFVIIVVTFTVD